MRTHCYRNSMLCITPQNVFSVVLLHSLPGDTEKEREMGFPVGPRNTYWFSPKVRTLEMKQTAIEESKQKIRATEVPLRTDGERATQQKYPQSLRDHLTGSPHWVQAGNHVAGFSDQARNWYKCSHGIFKRANSVLFCFFSSFYHSFSVHVA